MQSRDHDDSQGEKPMELQSYFEFRGNDSIRIAGTRVGIETVLRDYQEGASPEEIVLRYPTISLEQVHATLTYYLANRREVDTYLRKVRRRQEDAWQEQYRSPSEFVRSLRERLDRQRRAVREEPPPVPTVGG
ncbi:MAG: DUF433 domain-containing protein [Candidatus Binatia bacterium]